MEKTTNRKLVAKRRIRGLLIVLIVVLSVILLYDIFTFVKGWF